MRPGLPLPKRVLTPALTLPARVTPTGPVGVTRKYSAHRVTYDIVRKIDF